MKNDFERKREGNENLKKGMRKNEKGKKHTPRGVRIYAILKVLKLFHGRVSNVGHCWSSVFAGGRDQNEQQKGRKKKKKKKVK